MPLYKRNSANVFTGRELFGSQNRDRYLERQAHGLNTAKIQNYNFACFVWV